MVELVVPRCLWPLRREILDQIAAPRDVEQLHPTAHAENRHALRQRVPREGELDLIALAFRLITLRKHLLAIIGGIEVAPTCQQQPVQRGERRGSAL